MEAPGVGNGIAFRPTEPVNRNPATGRTAGACPDRRSH